MEESSYTLEETFALLKVNRALFAGLVFLLCVVGFLLIELTVFKPLVTCDTVSSLQEARAELPTHPGLDRNHNGKVCEEEFPNQ